MFHIVNKVRKTASVIDALREVKKLLRTKNETRWNSIYLMLVAFLKLDEKEVTAIVLTGFNTKQE